MKEIKLGTQNDTFVYALDIDGHYVKMDPDDFDYEQPDAKIYFDSGIYPGISDIDQYMCDKASAKNF